jgi:hypothetical protein
MKQSGYGGGYRDPHDFDQGIDPKHVTHLPDALRDAEGGPPRYVELGPQGWEAEAQTRLDRSRSEDPPKEPED